jgi:hypothetical protein
MFISRQFSVRTNIPNRVKHHDHYDNQQGTRYSITAQEQLGLVALVDMLHLQDPADIQHGTSWEDTIPDDFRDKP